MSSNQSSNPQDNAPQTIELNFENAGKILMQYVEVAQQKGAYLLNEASLLKRAADVVNGQTDAEVNMQTAYNLLIQGVVKGQKHGSYTLSDASILDKVVTFLVTPPQTNETTSSQQQSQPQMHVQATQEVEEELEELTAPVPLNAGSSGPKVI